MSNNKGYVIIGNSAGALNAAKSIREEDSSSCITIVSMENCLAYSPVLTTYLIGGMISEEEMLLADKMFYIKNRINLVLGKRVVTIMPSEHKVVLDDGSYISYYKLLIATGARPKMLENIDDSALDRVLTLRTIMDAQKIRDQIGHAEEIVIVGAGLISMQSANAILRQRPEMKVTIIASSNRILSRNVDEESACIIQKKLDSFPGVSIILNANINKIHNSDRRLQITLESGRTLFCDFMIVGKGVVPNIELVIGSGILFDKGIIVDEYLMTNLPDIYAAGDVTEGYHLHTSGRANIANWNNATEQGRIAGKNMAGYNIKFKGVYSANITNLFGVNIASIGLIGAGKELHKSDPANGMVRNFYIDDDKIIGAILVGDFEDVGIIRNAICNSTSLSSFSDDISRNIFRQESLLLASFNNV